MQITKELIERYHLGQCSPEEQYNVEQWLESDEVEMSFPEKTDLAILQNKGWKRLSNRYQILIETMPARIVKLRNYRMIWQLAACAVFLLGLATFYYIHTIGRNNFPKNNTIVYKEIKTVKGQKLSVTLPDGTVAWLNSESVLRFPESFRGTFRKLEFSGEAYFSVAKDPSKPFIIHTANTKIQVLGTKFNLRALTAEKTTSVVVVEGKVQFSENSDKQGLILTANKRGVFENVSSEAIMKAEDVYTSKYIAWKNNELLLDNVTLEEAVRILESWYNVNITISRPALLRERYTGNFSNPTLKQVLESIGFAVKFSYRQERNNYILY
ncbi:FecR family protein [Pedobacter nyackensis]|uniref:FecR family protein n=1 Tax=Pedobacter nyackensis TaxID=475255 RepID=UPI00292F90F2|nr:FecR family protein [Pedobacter nyackensis]